MKTPFRHSLEALADLAARSPQLYRIVSSASKRRRRRMNRMARGAGWLGAGVFLGAGLTSLLTPTTGAEIRKRISNQASRLRESIASRTHGALSPGPTAKRSARDDWNQKPRENGGFDAHA